ncbi:MULTISPECIES: hypothetical protein [Bradyrhizobium]|jgi:hypothetical protein|uniref:hypothetical protein n=1 Tax=Bradyrhizobium TaxID=374 RepID=UPI00155F9B69|nr:MULTISPECIES: hypothetical protein [Bradyrhizobium]
MGALVTLSGKQKPSANADSRAAMVMPWPCRVHAERDRRARHPAFPQQAFPDPQKAGSGPPFQSWGITCAQTAIMPINSEIDASAAASSTNNLNMNPTPYENI